MGVDMQGARMDVTQSEQVQAHEQTQDSAQVHEQGSSPQARALQKSQKTALVLTEGKSGRKIRITSAPCKLGRKGDYAPDLFTIMVSRVHILVNCERDIWTVENVGLNPCIIVSNDGRIQMEFDKTYPLYGGERLRIADMSFMVEIDGLSDEEIADARVEKPSERVKNAERALAELMGESHALRIEDDLSTNEELHIAPKISEERWFITCAKCGAKYEVENADARIQECGNCIDAMDRRQIARVVPVLEISE